MAHPSDLELIELSSGRLEEATAAAVRAHLLTCPACTGRLGSITEVDDALGRWSVEDRPIDVRQAVFAQLDRDAERRTPLWWPAAARLAAAAAISVAAGHVAGRVAAPWVEAPPRVTVATVEQDVALATLAGTSAAGLSEALMGGAGPEEGAP